jgi:hypothetical protein
VDASTETALMLAAKNGHTTTVIALLAAPGIQVNQSAQCGSTALIFAALLGHANTISALLLDPRVLVNLARPQDGNTALMVAVKYGRTKAVEALLADPTIDVNLVSRDGYTALSLASKTDQEIINCLQTTGAVLPVLRNIFIGSTKNLFEQNLFIQVPYLTKQAFDSLPEENRKRFAQGWENENAETLQAECVALLQKLVSIELHKLYDKYNAEVPSLDQLITDAANNVQYTGMLTMMRQECKMIQLKEHKTKPCSESQAYTLSAPLPTTTFRFSSSSTEEKKKPLEQILANLNIEPKKKDKKPSGN